jgi:hypothetical protein
MNFNFKRDFEENLWKRTSRDVPICGCGEELLREFQDLIATGTNLALLCGLLLEKRSGTSPILPAATLTSDVSETLSRGGTDAVVSLVKLACDTNWSPT